MAIYAENTGTSREPVEPGTYMGRCYQMIHIGHVLETIQGTEKKLNKVRLGFELPTELQTNGRPSVLSQEYTLSMSTKSNLRKMLESWRGKKFTDEEAKKFDITVLLGKPCSITVIVNDKGYENISAITTLMKGTTAPAQINSTQELNYDEFNEELFNDLPEFIKEKVKRSDEYTEMVNNKNFPIGKPSEETGVDENPDDLPF